MLYPLLVVNDEPDCDTRIFPSDAKATKSGASAPLDLFVELM